LTEGQDGYELFLARLWSRLRAGCS
jgi:hypothetical protein